MFDTTRTTYFVRYKKQVGVARTILLQYTCAIPLIDMKRRSVFTLALLCQSNPKANHEWNGTARIIVGSKLGTCTYEYRCSEV